MFTTLGITDSATAFSSPLKLTIGGYRDQTSAALGSVGGYGFYWCSDPSGTSAVLLYFHAGGLTSAAVNPRGAGCSIRLIKN